MVLTMKDLPPSMLEGMSLVPEDRPAALLIRHSLREELTNKTPGFDVPLTEAGVELAEQFGAALKFDVAKVLSSYAPRCVDTGKAILKGAGCDQPVQVVKRLSEPGCFVSDMKAAGQAFVRLGPLEFVNSSSKPGGLKGVLPVKQGTEAILDWLGREASMPGLSIFITHDTILATFVYCLLGRHPLIWDDWPQMLEGIFIWFVEDQAYAVWRGTEYIISG